VDANTRRIAGWVIAAVGLVIAVIGGLADQIGLGEEGSSNFGSQQLIALIVGLVVAAAGLALALKSKEEAAEPTGEAS
jgi:hypothetical protein